MANLTARSWPAGTAPIALRSFNIQMAAGSSISGFTASNVTHRVLFQDSAGDGGRAASVLDADGSVSGYPGAVLLPHSASTSLGFYSAPGCAAHPAYGLACPQRHVNLELGAWDWAGGARGGATGITRANLSPGRSGVAGEALLLLKENTAGLLRCWLLRSVAAFHSQARPAPPLPGAGLAAQRLPSLSGGELAAKASRGGRYYNIKAATGGSYLVAFGNGGSVGVHAVPRDVVQCCHAGWSHQQ